MTQETLDYITYRLVNKLNNGFEGLPWSVGRFRKTKRSFLRVSAVGRIDHLDDSVMLAYGGWTISFILKQLPADHSLSSMHMSLRDMTARGDPKELFNRCRSWSCHRSGLKALAYELSNDKLSDGSRKLDRSSATREQLQTEATAKSGPGSSAVSVSQGWQPRSFQVLIMHERVAHVQAMLAEFEFAAGRAHASGMLSKRRVRTELEFYGDFIVQHRLGTRARESEQAAAGSEHTCMGKQSRRVGKRDLEREAGGEREGRHATGRGDLHRGSELVNKRSGGQGREVAMVT